MNKKVAIFVAVLLAIVFVSGCTTGQVTSETKECPQPEEKALVSSYALDWYVNLYNENELYIEAAVFNYGYREAKNVEVTCKVFIESSEPIITAKDYIGNIASTSFKEVTIISEIDQGVFDEYGDDYTAYIICVPTSCDDCVSLEKRIHEYQEYF